MKIYAIHCQYKNIENDKKVFIIKNKITKKNQKKLNNFL